MIVFPYYVQEARCAGTEEGILAGFHFQVDARDFAEQYSARNTGQFVTTRTVGGSVLNTFERGHRL